MAVSQPDRVRLTGMRFDATHGVYDFERVEPQAFVVDVDCRLSPRPSSDDLATTVDYAELSRAIAADVTGEPVNLIETLAERIAAFALEDARVRAVRVRIEKLKIIPDAASVGVEIERLSGA